MNRRDARSQLARILACSLGFSGLFPASAHADFYFHPWESHHSDDGRLTLNLDFDYWDTRSNFGPTPAGFNDYTKLETNALGAYGLGRLTLFGRFSYAYVNLDSGTLAGMVYGPTDQSMGATFRILGYEKPGPASVDLQIQADLAAYNDHSTTTPWLGDGSGDFTAGALGRYTVWTGSSDVWEVAGGAGFTYRTGYSAAIPWSLSLQFSPIRGSGLSLKFTGTGIYSLHTDLTNNPALASLGSGGSFITGAINPSLVSGIAQLGYQFSSGKRAYVSFQDTVFGQSAPNGICLAVGLQTYFGAGTGHPEVTQATDRFVGYSLQARVRRVNDRLALVKIDKGTQDGVEVGQIFDIFKLKKDGSLGSEVARAKVIRVNVSEAALSVLDYYQQVWIDEGFVARRVME